MAAILDLQGLPAMSADDVCICPSHISSIIKTQFA